MLEKAKNRKIFYFFVFIILGFSLFISPVFAVTCYPSNGAMPEIIKDTTTTDKAIQYIRASYDSVDNPWSSKSPCSAVYYSPVENWDSGDIAHLSSSSESGTFNLKLTNALGVYVSEDIDYNLEIDGSDLKITLQFYNWNESEAIESLHNTFWISDISGYWSSLHIEDWKNAYSSAYDDLDETFYLCADGTSRMVPITTESECFYTTDYEYISYDAIITATPTSGYLPLEISFTDASTGFPEEYPYPTYILTFGDGSFWEGERQYAGENWFHTYHYDGTYNYSYAITNDGTTYYDNGSITVSDALSNYYVELHGLNTAPIEGANVSIWYNGEYQDSEGSSSIGRAYFTIPPYRFVNGTVTKPGYQTAYFDTYIYPEDNFEIVTLYADNETQGSGDSYGNYIVTFKNAVTGENVGYSNIEVYSDSGYTSLFYDEYSNSAGIWTGLIPMNTTYYYKFPETIDYYSQSWSYNLISSPAYKTVNLIPKSAATSTATPTPTITTTTITPTVTYTYNDSNLSSLNVKERFTNLLVLAGFQNAESADLIFAMIIVLGCTALIGWITLSGSGAGMGAIIGFVFSLGLGLIPLWLLIAAIFFGCLYVALKLFGGSGE